MRHEKEGIAKIHPLNEIEWSSFGCDAKHINEKAKELGLWGIGKRIAIGKSGTSLIIRIPKDIAELYKIQNGGTALIFPEGKNRICLEV